MTEHLFQSVVFTKQSVAVKQLWGTMQWLWQCSFQHTTGYSLALIHCVARQMVEKLTQTTNNDKDTTCPSSCPSIPPAGTNKSGTGTALLHHYNVKTESFYFNNYTQFGENKISIRLPCHKWGIAQWDASRWRGECSAALVVRLYCAPLIGLCRQRHCVNLTDILLWLLLFTWKELTWLLLASFSHQSDKWVDFMPFKEKWFFCEIFSVFHSVTQIE